MSQEREASSDLALALLGVLTGAVATFAAAEGGYGAWDFMMGFVITTMSLAYFDVVRPPGWIRSLAFGGIAAFGPLLMIGGVFGILDLHLLAAPCKEGNVTDCLPSKTYDLRSLLVWFIGTCTFGWVHARRGHRLTASSRH